MLPHNPVVDLVEYYDIKKPDVVREYLSSRPYLVPLLQEIPSKVDEYFGPGNPLVLAPFYYSDGVVGDHDLWVYIQGTWNALESRARMRAFDQGWFLEASHLYPGLNVDVGFVSLGDVNAWSE